MGQLEQPRVTPVPEIGLDEEQRLFFMMRPVQGKRALVLEAEKLLGRERRRP